MPITSQRKMLSFAAVKNCVANRPRKPGEKSDCSAAGVAGELEAERAAMRIKHGVTNLAAAGQAI